MSFNPGVTHDFHKLKSLFSTEQPFAEMELIPEEELARPSDYLYYNRWEVSLILVSAPLAVISYLFLKVVSLILWSNHIALLARKTLFPIGTLSKQIILFGSALWVPTDNEYRIDLHDIYDLPSIKRENILDPTIKSKLTNKLNKINFSQLGVGHCWGSCHWFNYLLLKKLKTTPFEKAIVQVAKLFEEGQPRQAVLLQSFYGLELDLLGLTSTKTLDYSLDGAYLINSHNHAVCYIRWEDKEFAWDPVEGLIYLDSQECADEAFANLVGLCNLFKHSLKETD